MDNKFEDGVLVARRIKLFMRYELDKTYTENLQEQPDSKMPFQIEKYGYNPNNPSSLEPALQKQQNHLRSLIGMDAHDWLVLISITSGIFAMIPSPLSPILFGISLTSDIIDAAKYIQEGDKYTGGLFLALAIIPGHQLIKELKHANTFKKLGKEGVTELIKKSKLGTITKKESKILKQAVGELGNESEVLVRLTNQIVKQNILKNLGKKSLKFLINLLFLLKSVGTSTGKLGLQIAGIYYLFDEIYLAIFADDIKELDVRKYGKVQQLIALIKKDENYFKELLIRENIALLDEAIKKGIDLTLINPTETVKVSLEKFKQNIKNNEQQIRQKMIKPPSFEMVLSKKINPETKKLYTIKKGQNGEIIHEIQKLLVKAGYEDILAGYYENQPEAVDGFFGDNTETSVKEFQKDNGILVDGVIGSQTLKLLIQKTK
jgi:peptidoglycan hydrolase-like protein with peptidoglycan-binding domain